MDADKSVTAVFEALPPEPGECIPVPGNEVVNPSFESDLDNWRPYPSSAVSASTPTGDAAHCEQAVRLVVNDASASIQFYQTGINIRASQSYRFRFYGKSSTGHDISVYLHDHKSTSLKLGMNNVEFDLTSEWQMFTYDFRAPASSTNARLRFWWASHDANGDVYMFDQVVIVADNE